MRSHRRPGSCRAIGLALALALIVVGCGGRSPVARLLEGQGAVEREHGGQTKAAAKGQAFVVGDAARTGADAWARLRLRGGAVLRMGADARIRFLAGGARLEVGDATAEDAPVTILTEAGPAIIERGGVVRASARDGGFRFEVVVGRAEVQGKDGVVTLEAGGGLVIAVGGAILERLAPPPTTPPTPPPPDPPTPPPGAPATALTATVTGRGATSQVDGGPWQPLAAGATTLAPGTAVKLPRGTSLGLARGDDRATMTGPAELTIGDPTGGPLATAASGRARVTARAGEVAIAVPGGVIITRAGGDAVVDVGRADSRARVERGEVMLDGTVSDATAGAGELGVLDRAGAASLRERTPTTIDVTVDASERAEIHDPAGEVAVRVEHGDVCAGAEAALELSDGKGSFADPRVIAGVGGAAFFARAGTTRFRVRCAGGAVGRTGSVRVDRRTGTDPIRSSPPSDAIQLTGQSYTLHYQTRPPGLAVSWAEARGPTTLHVLPAGGAERTFEATGVHHVASGTLDEGTTTLWMTAGARSSPRTRVTIVFDNAAPTARIDAPAPRAAWIDPLPVRGVIVEGWTVSVDGRAATVDAQGRFRAEVAVGDRRVIVVRLAHPQHGVHYYLRRRP